MKPGIALQLFTLRDAAAEDLHGALARARESGFEYVQWSGMPELPAEEARAALARAGLAAVAGHCPLEAFEDDFARTAAFWQALGVRDVAPGGMMEDCRDTREAWLRGAERLDAMGARLRKAGLRLSYHNHAFELEPFPGDTEPRLDLLYRVTQPDRLYAELDTAWLRGGGVDPAAYLRKYAGRCPVIHVKDLAENRDVDGNPVFVPLGQGILDWPVIFEAARAAGVEWYIYEQDTYEVDVFESVRASYAFLKEYV